MIFNSFDFLLFFPIVTILYFLLPHKTRWLFLLAASCFFYMFFKPIYILILGFTIVIDYLAGILIEGKTNKKKKKLFLIMSLVANIGILAVFKYYNFVDDNIRGLGSLLGVTINIPYLKILLPIGLSFHTFQAMSYTIEVYRGNQQAERQFGIYSLYVMFYPQLVAGPIERPQNLLHQFHEKHDFNYGNFVNGCRHILWGVFKKVVIADRLSLFVDPIFNNPSKYSGCALVIAAVFFSFQLYCDFSGYSSIAIGCAKVMGINLMTNFNKPFKSRSISELWRRWHISLSSWFNEYLFNPIVSSLRNWGKYAIVFGLIATFVLCGLWHGASWKFVLFGLMQGVAIAYEYLTRKWRKRIFGILPLWLNNCLSKIIAFTYFSLSLVFFRAMDLTDSIAILKKIAQCVPELIKSLHNRKYLNNYIFNSIHLSRVYSGIALIFLLEIIHVLQKDNTLESFIAGRPRHLRWFIYFISFIIIYFGGVFNSRQFIYFQF